VIELFGRELTIEQLKSFVQVQEVEGEVKIPKDWVLELIDSAQENEKLKERLQISPYGDDKIDELEEALEHCKFQLKLKTDELTKLKNEIAKLYKAVCRVYDTTDDISAKEILDKYIGKF
jgi:hypothetical protein